MLSDIKKDLWKLVIVGGVSWVIGSIYTSWRLQPERNISIIPLSAVMKTNRMGTYCNVDHAALRSLIDSGKALEMADYLGVLIQSKGPVFMDVNALSAKAAHPDIFSCPGNLRPVPNTTFNAALIMDQSVTYLLEKQCELKFKLENDDARVPVMINTIRDESPFPISGTQLIELSYDLTRDQAIKPDQAPLATINKLENDLSQAAGANQRAGREMSVAIECRAAYKRPWHEFWSNENVKRLTSGLEKIKVDRITLF
jgi:hypothetical protein